MARGSSRRGLSPGYDIPALLTSITAGRYTVRGVSLGGIYTALHVPELDVGLDIGLAPRSMSGIRTLCLSHGHADHVGGLVTLLGLRALMGQKKPLRVIMPAEIEADLLVALRAMAALQRWPLDIEPIGLRPGDELELRADVRLRAFKTFHPVPSLGYQLFRRVSKLKSEFLGKDGPTIAKLKHQGVDIFDAHEYLELAYATDSLVQVLDHEPSLYDSRVLIMECTFLDERKPVATARAGCHVHLDELIERAHLFANEQLVLMHFSSVYRPSEIAGILDRRLPPELRARVIPFVPPPGQDWPG